MKEGLFAVIKMEEKRKRFGRIMDKGKARTDGCSTNQRQP